MVRYAYRIKIRLAFQRRVVRVRKGLLGDRQMLRTITIGSCVSIQGLMVRQLADGKIVVKVDEQTFTGHPVASNRKQ